MSNFNWIEGSTPIGKDPIIKLGSYSGTFNVIYGAGPIEFIQKECKFNHAADSYEHDNETCYLMALMYAQINEN